GDRLRAWLLVLEVYDAHAMLLGDGLQQLLVVDEPAAKRDLAHAEGVGTSFFEEVPELALVDEAEVDHDLADLAFAVVPLAVGLGGRLGRRFGGRLARRLRLRRGRLGAGLGHPVRLLDRRLAWLLRVF